MEFIFSAKFRYSHKCLTKKAAAPIFAALTLLFFRRQTIPLPFKSAAGGFFVFAIALSSK
jgi:hypothetical protein